MRLQDKRAIITGASSGIGRATALKFATEGAHVILVDVDVNAGQDAAAQIQAKGGRACFIETDVTDEQAVKDMVTQAGEAMGGIDVLMNNAGSSLTEDLLEIDLEAWNADVTLNLTSHFLCTRAALPVMIGNGGGSVISTSSVNGFWAIGEFGYSAAKAALLSFIKNVAVRYGSDGIRANVISPGTIDTEHGGAYWDQKAGGKEKLIKWYPVGRLGKPEDVAHLAVYLASDESSFVSGSMITIDGGLTAGTRLLGEV